jgi:hypothetical protein
MAIASAASPGLVAKAGETGWEEALADRLLGAYPSRSSLQAIGEAHLQEAGWSTVSRPALEGVLRAVLADLDLSPSSARRAASADIRARIRNRTASDFADGRTARVKGWLLGRTEARLCALAALRSA